MQNVKKSQRNILPHPQTTCHVWTTWQGIQCDVIMPSGMCLTCMTMGLTCMTMGLTCIVAIFVTNYQICREIGRYDVIKSHMTGRYDVIKSHDWRQPLFQFFGWGKVDWEDNITLNYYEYFCTAKLTKLSFR